MSLTTVFAAVAAMAVNFGWQKADDGYEYLVQLEPETLQLLQDGIDVPIDSHVPEGVQPIRRVRIVVGKAELPRAELTATDEPRTDEPRTNEAVEQTANWRPGDSVPPADGRYPAQQPAAPQPSAIDTMVQPLRDVDNFVEQGFEKGVDGLEKTGQTIRDTVGNVGTGVHEHLQRGKDAIFGSTPNNSFPSASAAATTPATTAAAPAPAWKNAGSAPANGNNSSIPGLPAPPLAGTDPPAASGPTLTSPAGAAGADNTWPSSPPDTRATESMTGTDSGSRMVTIEPVASDTGAPKVPAWDPEWPAVATQPASSTSSGWPAPTTTASATNTPPTAQPDATTAGASIQTPAPSSKQTPPAIDNPSTVANSLGGWALAIIGLAGSVGCNFFLGFSYLDIRNKYRAALRRTSRSFGRPAASA